MIDEGYIISNKYRRAIFDELASGETNPIRITKKHRIIPRITQRILDDFEQNDIIKKDGRGYQLTEKGNKLKQTMGN